METAASRILRKDQREMIIEIAIERLRDFKDHPFKVKDDYQMRQLKESVSQYGILVPLVVRPTSDGVYEIISGHRRKHAAWELGFEKVPVIIRAMQDAEAVIAMIDSNLQREQISYSEKAFAYRMKYEAMKKGAASRKEHAGGRFGYHMKGKKTIHLIAEEENESAKQIQRYLKLTELIPELLEYLDEGRISFNPAYELAFLPPDRQKELLNAMNYANSSPSLSQAQRMKKNEQGRKADQYIHEEHSERDKKG